MSRVVSPPHHTPKLFVIFTLGNALTTQRAFVHVNVNVMRWGGETPPKPLPQHSNANFTLYTVARKMTEPMVNAFARTRLHKHTQHPLSFTNTHTHEHIYYTFSAYRCENVTFRPAAQPIILQGGRKCERNNTHTYDKRNITHNTIHVQSTM